MFEYLHCSPIKLQITFSSSQTEQEYKENNCHPLIDYLFYAMTSSFTQEKPITLKLVFLNFSRVYEWVVET